MTELPESLPPDEPEIVQRDPVVDAIYAMRDEMVDYMLASIRLQDLIAQRLLRPPEPLGPATFDLPFTHKLRIFVHYIVISVTSACTVTLTMGRVTREYIFGNADTRTFPLRIMIDRGINVTLSATAGTATGYVVGNYE